MNSGVIADLPGTEPAIGKVCLFGPHKPSLLSNMVTISPSVLLTLHGQTWSHKETLVPPQYLDRCTYNSSAREDTQGKMKEWA